MQLLTPADRNQSGRGHLYFKHNAAGILRADAAGRGAFYRALWNVGGITINEIRELEDLSPSPDPLADQSFVPLNMVPLNMLVEKLRQEPALPAPAVPEKENEDAE